MMSSAIAKALDGRESAFELHASGGMANWRSCLRRSFKDYNSEGERSPGSQSAPTLTAQ
jgi:hypothetical protein